MTFQRCDELLENLLTLVGPGGLVRVALVVIGFMLLGETPRVELSSPHPSQGSARPGASGITRSTRAIPLSSDRRLPARP